MSIATHTMGPWAISKRALAYHGGGTFEEITIHTAWEHGQLKAPAPVVTSSLSVGADGKAQWSVFIREEDARLIAAAPCLLAALEEYQKALFDGPENCSYSTYERIEAQASAAIARAKGAA